VLGAVADAGRGFPCCEGFPMVATAGKITAISHGRSLPFRCRHAESAATAPALPHGLEVALAGLWTRTSSKLARCEYELPIN
jgi:hypothetical protein